MNTIVDALDDCRITVRAIDGTRCYESDDWTADMVLAALTAEPETLCELWRAMRRYQRQHNWHCRGVSDVALEDAPGSDCWCVVDLIGRTIVFGNGYQGELVRGCLAAPVPIPHTSDRLWFYFPSDWHSVAASEDWLSVVEQRAEERRARRLWDVREVLYGAPLIEHLSKRILELREEGLAGKDRDRLELTRRIHVEWMMAPREDLGDRTPRQWLLRDRIRIEEDLQSRAQQWSREGKAPVGLEPDSHAYRYGGFGTAEIIIYFNLIRELMEYAWMVLGLEDPPLPEQLPELLMQRQDYWMNETFDSMSSHTPAQLIDLERRRIPATDDHATPMDCDCPICQAMADENSGPSFVFFDGCNLELEEEFAFSLEEDYDTWKDQCGEPMSPDFHEQETGDDVEPAASMLTGTVQAGGRRRERRGEAQKEESIGDNTTDSDSGSIWKSSFVDWNYSQEMGGSYPIMGLTFLLAEIVDELKRKPRSNPFVKQLNRTFSELRKSETIEGRYKAADRLADHLERVAKRWPDLTARCADFQSRMHEVLRITCTS